MQATVQLYTKTDQSLVSHVVMVMEDDSIVMLESGGGKYVLECVESADDVMDCVLQRVG